MRLLGALAVTIFASFTAARGALMVGAWGTAAPMPIGLCQAIAVTDPLSGDIYVGGGYSTPPGSTESNVFNVYHPSSNTWSPAASMPLVNRGANGAWFNGRIYVFGGSAGTAAKTSVQIYTIATNSWTTLSFPLGNWEAGAAMMTDGTIILTGGSNNSGHNVRYDFATNTSTLLAPYIHTDRNGLETGQLLGSVFAVGGFEGAGPGQANLDRYDPLTNTWSTSPADLPAGRGRGRMASAVFNNHLLIAGGSSGYTNTVAPYFTDFDIYDPLANAWQTGAPLPVGTREAIGAVSGTNFYVFGGYTASGITSAVRVIAIPEPTGAAAVMLLSCSMLARRVRRQNLLPSSGAPWASAGAMNRWM
jgi:N-acetylneuraminic acid mutarotase